MASGSRERFALDLNNIMDFPDNDNIPIFPPKEGESWIMLLEITSDESLIRPVYATKDVTGAHFIVALYTPTPHKDAKNLNFKVGYTVCITSERPGQFLDGRVGYRIEDPSIIQVLPVSLAELWGINAKLRQCSDGGNLLNCNVCNRPSGSICGVCKVTRYCSTECQRSHWQQHKKECLAMKALHGWNRTDFG